MRLALNIGWLVFGAQYAMWVWGEAIRLVAPRYHARMLAAVKSGRWARGR